MNNPGPDQRGISDPAPCSGAERRDKVLTQSAPQFTVAQPPYKKEILTPPGRQQRRPDPTTVLTTLLKSPFLASKSTL